MQDVIFVCFEVRITNNLTMDTYKVPCSVFQIRESWAARGQRIALSAFEGNIFHHHFTTRLLLVVITTTTKTNYLQLQYKIRWSDRLVYCKL